MEQNNLFLEFLFVISFVTPRNYLFKVSNLSTRIRCESCSILKTSILSIFNIKKVNDVVLVSLLLTVKIFQTFLIVAFEQAKVWFVHIEKVNAFKVRLGISCVMYYFRCEQHLLTNSSWTYTITTLWVTQWEIFAKEFTSDFDSG